MILFDLKCDKQHVFEAWFSDSAAYDKQVKAKVVSCPDCGSTRISKAPMAPNLGKGTRKTGGVEIDKRAAAGTALKALSELRQQVEKNFDNVGDKFPEEARKIHYGEAEDRSLARAQFSGFAVCKDAFDHADIFGKLIVATGMNGGTVDTAVDDRRTDGPQFPLCTG